MSNEKSPSSVIDRIIRFICICIAKSRIRRNHCPQCNDDAPELYNCKVCLGYRHNTDRYGKFSNSMKTRLLEDFLEYHQ